MDANLLQPVTLLLFVLVVIFLILTFVMLVRFYKRSAERQRAAASALEVVKSTNQQFVLSTFQGVIQRLKEQEQELERLRRLEKKRADLGQKLSENITRHMPTGLITVNRAGIITSSNPAAKEILNQKILENMHFSQVLSSPGRLQEMVDNCLRQGERYHRAEMEVLLNSRQRKDLGISISPIESSAREISGVVCLISDLTELVALQQQVRLKESLAIVGEMSAGIAHEFKNSLGAIQLYAQLLQKENLPDKLNNSLSMIAKEAAQLSATFNEFLNFARPQELERTPLDLCELLRECVTEMTLDPRFKHAEFQADGAACPFKGDCILLKRAILNLLSNAAESIPAANAPGKVTCCLRFRPDEQPFPVELEIADNGCGIAAEDIERIFIPFVTGKNTGTGLGLAIVQKIVLLHDGKIEVESSVGQGSRFRVRLPGPATAPPT